MFELISQYQKKHKEDTSYGVGGITYKDTIQNIIDAYGCRSLLDYGCGKGKLVEYFSTSVYAKGYDPAIKKYSTLPDEYFDLVLCTDVLEHVPERYLRYVIDDLVSKANYILFLAVCCREAYNSLPDGSNCHVTVKASNWWKEVLTSWTNYKIISETLNEEQVLTLTMKHMASTF